MGAGADDAVGIAVGGSAAAPAVGGSATVSAVGGSATVSVVGCCEGTGSGACTLEDACTADDGNNAAGAGAAGTAVPDVAGALGISAAADQDNDEPAAAAFAVDAA